jgi:hypothetical protein
MSVASQGCEQGDQSVGIFANWANFNFGQFLKSSLNFGPLFHTVKVICLFWPKNDWASFWVIFSQTHLATLVVSLVRYACTKDAYRVARFSLYNIPKRRKIYQITIKYTKWPQDIPNGHKIDRLASKYNNIIYCKTLQNLPKLGFLVWKYCHLATLAAYGNACQAVDRKVVNMAESCQKLNCWEIPLAKQLDGDNRVTRLGEFSPIMRLFIGQVFLKNYNFWTTFSTVCTSYALI